MTTRRSRFTRSDPDRGFVLQERDRQIMIACYQYRHLTRKQLQHLFGWPCVNRANARLRTLFDRKFLDRRMIPNHCGSGEALYSVGPEALPLVAATVGESVEAVRATRDRDRTGGDGLLLHQLAVNDFRIAIVTACRHDRSFTLNRWQEARECEQRFEAMVRGKKIHSTLRPDGFFQLTHHDRLYSFCFELDRGTSGRKKLEAKFQLYSDFVAAGLAAPAFGVNTLYVLVVTTTPARRDDLLALASAMKVTSFFFAALPDVTTNALRESVWHRVGEDTTRALFPATVVRTVS